MSRFNPNCWSDAEQNIFDHLVKETDSTPNQDAFLGLMPVAGFNMWALTSGGGPGTHLNAQGVPVDILTKAIIEVVYDDRAECQSKAMTIMNAMPMRDVGNVHLLRPDSVPSIEPEWIPIAGDSDHLRRVWFCSITCQLVYLTTR